MGKKIKSEKVGGKESKFIEEYTPLLIFTVNQELTIICTCMYKCDKKISKYTRSKLLSLIVWFRM
jgi:hypothetical protein